MTANSSEFAKNHEHHFQSREHLLIWKLSEVPTGVQIMDLPVCVACLSCSSDGRLLAIGTCAAEDEDPANEGGSVIIWDLTSKKSVASLHANQGTIYSIAMHPTGRILAAGGEDGTIVLWDLTIFKPIATLRCQSSVAALAFSPDGERIFAGIGNDVFVWDMKTKSELNHLTGHANNITKIAFTTDGKSIATASRDRQIFLWNYSNDRGQHRATIYGGSRTPTSLAFAPNGRILASANDDGAILLYHADNR